MTQHRRLLPARWETPHPREIAPEDWQRFERHIGEILDRARHGSRHARHARDAAAVPAGAPTTRPQATTATRSCAPRSRASGRTAVDGAHSQIVEGPISFFALCEHHALPFHGVAHVAYVAGRRDHRDLEADPARAPLRAPLHGAGAARRADRRHARRTRPRRAASPFTSRRRTSARRCAASTRRARGR